MAYIMVNIAIKTFTPDCIHLEYSTLHNVYLACRSASASAIAGTLAAPAASLLTTREPVAGISDSWKSIKRKANNQQEKDNKKHYFTMTNTSVHVHVYVTASF